MCNRKHLFIGLATLLISVTAPAASISVVLDQSHADPVLPDGRQYLEVNVSDGQNDGAIDFSVQALDGLLSLDPSQNFGIQQFAFNFGSSGATIADLTLPSGWSATVGDERDFYKFGFGEFDVILHTSRSYRANPLEFSINVGGDTPNSYATQLSGGAAIEGNMLFAAYVAGFSATHGEKENWQSLSAAKFGGASVVPLPPAIWLFGTALLMLIGQKRKANNNNF